MQPPKAIALSNAFFSSGVLMEHTKNCLAEKAWTWFLISYCTQIMKKQISVLQGLTQRRRDEVFCVVCKEKTKKKPRAKDQPNADVNVPASQ